MPKKKEIKVHYGGQAVMEGVMMRGKDAYCLAVRNPEGEIETRSGTSKVSGATAVLGKIPIIRGIVRLGSSLLMGMKVIKDSTEIAGTDIEGEPSKFDLWLERKFGDKLTNIIMVIAVVISLGFSVALFMVLPTWLSGFMAPVLDGNLWALGIIEGLVRFVIFFAYLILISRLKDIRRVFQYHGAEHKVINCFESGQELHVEHIKKHNRLHRRCGTSFLMFVMVISMIFFLFVRTEVLWLRVLSRILFVPFIAGVSFEVIRWAGQSTSPFVRVVSFPGLMLQKLTTAEPDERQIEVAIVALEGVIDHENKRAALYGQEAVVQPERTD